MNIKKLKDNKFVRNLPTILLVTGAITFTTLAVVVIHSVNKEIRMLPLDDINKAIKEGTASILQDPDGTIHIFW